MTTILLFVNAEQLSSSRGGEGACYNACGVAPAALGTAARHGPAAREYIEHYSVYGVYNLNLYVRRGSTPPPPDPESVRVRACARKTSCPLGLAADLHLHRLAILDD